MGFLTHEKSAAEQYAVILATSGRRSPPCTWRGIQLYAEAKAEFDAVIAELKFDLTTGQEPMRSAVFTSALHQAAGKRVAFTTFVSHEVVDKVQGGRNGPTLSRCPISPPRQAQPAEGSQPGSPTARTAARSRTKMEQCGYVPVRHPDRNDGLWIVNKTRLVIYAKEILPFSERVQAARRLTAQARGE